MSLSKPPEFFHSGLPDSMTSQARLLSGIAYREKSLANQEFRPRQFPPVPDGITPLVGIRGFKIAWDPEAQAVRLGSLHVLYAWQPGWNDAVCVKILYQCDVPDEQCACGIYAFSPEFWGTLFSQGYLNKHNLVTGVVELAGKIIVGSAGFRASRARIVALRREITNGALPVGAWTELPDLLAEHYAVPLVDDFAAWKPKKEEDVA